MRISGFVKQSFVDYPGKIAAAVFTQGCNMNCSFCHNRCLVGDSYRSLVTKDEIFSFLLKRKKFLDGVVVTGGEPTLQPELQEFIEKIKDLGYLVKLDTNGTCPRVIKELLDKNLLDYIAMDIKAPMKNYVKICRSDVNKRTLLESISLIMNSNTAYEFRTTYCPQLIEKDIIEICELIRGAKKYVLQQYRETDELKGGYTGKTVVRDFYEEPGKNLCSFVSDFKVRGEINIHSVSLQAG